MTRYKEQLSALCKRPGYSRYSVGKAAGYNKNYVSDVVRGNITPSIDALEKLANALDVPLSELLFGDETTQALNEISSKILSLDEPGLKAVHALVDTLATDDTH